MCTDEIRQAKELWVRRAQKRIPQDTETPGWRSVEDKETGVLKCVGWISGYRPTYFEDCLLTQKLIRHLHSEIKHLGVANTMAEIRKEWWIPKLISKVIKDVKKTLYKTLGRTHLTFEQLEAVVIDVEKTLNNRPLTYLGSDGGEEQVLTQNILMWGCYNIVIFTPCVEFHLHVLLESLYIQFRLYLRGT